MRSITLVNSARRSSSTPNRELGDRVEGGAYGNLGNAFHGLGQYSKAVEFHTKHLNISRELGDRDGEGVAYGNLGNAFYSLGQIDKSVEFLTKRLNISRELGDRAGEVRIKRLLEICKKREYTTGRSAQPS